MRRYPALPRPLLGGTGIGRRAGSRGARGSVGRGAARAQASGTLGIRTRLGVTLDSWLGRPAAGRSVGLQRERHEPEYLIILAVVALTAVGILMVYSSSAIRSYVLSQNTFAVVGPQLVWAVLGVIAMVVTMQIDYRYWRLASIPVYVAALALLVLVLLPGIGVRVGGSARWLQIGSLPAVHPAEFAKLALVIYLAHWLTRRGTTVGSIRHGRSVPADRGALHPPRAEGARPRDDRGHRADGVPPVLRRGCQPLAVLPAGAGRPRGRGAGDPLELVPARADPRVPRSLERPDGQGAGRLIQGLLALGLGGTSGPGLGASRLAFGLYLPNASNDFIFAIIGEEFGLLGGLVVIGLFALLAYQGFRVALAAPDTFGGLLGGRHHHLDHGPGHHQRRRGGLTAADHRHHAALHQRRWLVADDQSRGRRHPALHLPRDTPPRNVERCGS